MSAKLKLGGPRYHIHAFEKSIVFNGRTLFPISEPEKIAHIIAQAAQELSENSYNMGRRDLQAEMRKSIGVK